MKFNLLSIGIIFYYLLISVNSYGQNYTLEFQDLGLGGSTWTGTYNNNQVTINTQIVNYLSLGRLDTNDDPINGSVSVYGGEDGCNSISGTDGSNESPEQAGKAFFPDNSTLRITNSHPDESTFIKFWDNGNGDLGPVGYPFGCDLDGTADVVLAPGQSIYLIRNGDIIEEFFPVPTISQWGFTSLMILILIIGVIVVRTRKAILSS